MSMRRHVVARAVLSLAMACGAVALFRGSAGADAVSSVTAQSISPAAQVYYSPTDVVRDTDGTTWIADSGNNRVLKLSASGELVGMYPPISSTVTLNSPQSIAIADGKVYVADTGNHRIVVLDAAGVVERVSDSFGSGAGQFKSPQGIVVNAGKVWVADTGNHRIQRLSLTLTPEASYGTAGSGALQFSSPRGLAVSGSSIYIADAGNQRIAVISTSGAWVDSWGLVLGTSEIPTYSRYSTPSDVWVAGSTVYVLDTSGILAPKPVPGGGTTFDLAYRPYRVEACTTQGVPILAWGTSGSGNAQLFQPKGIWADGSTVLIADTGNNRVQSQTTAGEFVRSWKFGIDKTAPITATSEIPTGWSRELTVTLTATDDVGVAETRYRIGTGSLLKYEGVLSDFPDGLSTLYYRSSDFLGRSETTRSATIRIDRTPPTMSTNESKSWRNTPEIVTLTAQDPYAGISSLTYRIGTGAWTSYTGSILVGSDAHGQGELPVTFRASDTAGNEATHTAVVKIDKTAPITTSNASMVWRTTPETLTLTPSDTAGPGSQGSGVDRTQYRIGDAGALRTYSGPFRVDSEGETRVYFYSTDRAGNVETSATARVYIDRTPPVTTISVGEPSPTDTRLVTLDRTDAGGSGGRITTYYRVNGSIRTAYSEPFEVSSLGDVVLDFWSIDSMGNTEANHRVLVENDFDPPVTTSNLDGKWRSTPATVTLSAMDEMSGPPDTYYRLNTSETVTTYVDPFEVDAEGTTKVTYWSEDKKGIRELDNVGWVRIDRTPPQTTADVRYDPYRFAATVELTADDGDGSGVKTTEYQIDAHTDWLEYDAPISIDTPGEHEIRYRSTDELGHTEDVRRVPVVLDSPGISTTSNITDGWYTASVQVLLFCDYNGPDPVQTEYRTSATGAWSLYAPFWVSSEGITTIYYRSKAGSLVEPERSRNVKIDRTPPVTSVERVGRASVVLHATDTGSGVDGVDYRFGTDASWIRSGDEPIDMSGQSTILYRAVDNAGNQEYQRTYRIPPVTRFENPPSGWQRNAVTVVLSAQHDGDAPLQTQYKIGAGGAESAYHTAFTIASDGVVDLYYRSVAGDAREEWQLARIRIDKSAPSTLATPNRLADPNRTRVTLSPSDGGSGLAATYYRLGDGAWTLYTGPFEVSGEVVVSYYSVDVAGNSEPPKSIHITPAVTLSMSAPAVSSYRSAKLSGYLASFTAAGARTPLSGKTVKVQQYTSGKWTTIAKVTTSSTGRWSYTAKPTKKATYRAVYSTSSYSVTSAKATVLPKLYFSSAPRSSTYNQKLGRSYTFSGYFKPKHGSGSKQIKIRAYRYEGGKYVLKKTYSTKVTNPSGSSSSKYTRSIKLPSKGTWRIRAYHAADSSNAATLSSSRTVRVK